MYKTREMHGVVSEGDDIDQSRKRQQQRDVGCNDRRGSWKAACGSAVMQKKKKTASEATRAFVMQSVELRKNPSLIHLVVIFSVAARAA